MDQGSPASFPRHTHGLKVDLQLSVAELVYGEPLRAPCPIRPDHRVIRLHTAAPPPHGLAVTNPDSTPFIVPCHVHQGFDQRIYTAGSHTPCLGTTIHRPQQNHRPRR